MVTQRLFMNGSLHLKARVATHRPSAIAYGDAYVNKLAGSTFIHHAPGYSVIPVVPFMDQQYGIPFSASIECLEAGSQEQHPLRFPTPSPTPSLAVPRISTPSMSSPLTPPPSDLLDVFYVLSGEGSVVSSDGGTWPLVSGDCLVAWHGSVLLHGRTSDTPSLDSSLAATPPSPMIWSAAVAGMDASISIGGGASLSSPSPDAMAVLRFNVPASLVLPSGAISATSRVASPLVTSSLLPASLSDAGSSGSVYSRSTVGTDDAAMLMRGVQRRADRALHTLQEKIEVKAAKLSALAATAPSLLSPSIAALSSLDSHPQIPFSSISPAPPLTYTYINGGSTSSSSSSSSTTSGSSSVSVTSHPPPLSPGASPSSSSANSNGDRGSTSTILHAPSPPLSVLSSPSVLMQRPLEDFKAFRFPPPQTNRLAFVFDPSELGLSMSFGIEVFEPGHVTPLHSHMEAHELFFVLGGEGTALCNGRSWPVSAGDCLVFPPTSIHGIDNRGDGRLYCLQLMSPNESFVEYVKQGGIAMGSLDDEDLCMLANVHC